MCTLVILVINYFQHKTHQLLVTLYLQHWNSVLAMHSLRQPRPRLTLDSWCAVGYWMTGYGHASADTVAKAPLFHGLDQALHLPDFAEGFRLAFPSFLLFAGALGTGLDHHRAHCRLQHGAAAAAAGRQVWHCHDCQQHLSINQQVARAAQFS